jgi:hypothetical protein
MAEFSPIDEATFRRGAARAQRSRGPRALSARFDKSSRRIAVRLDTGIEFSFEPSAAHGLEAATEEDLADVAVDGAGGALHFPALDADFSIARLLEGFLGPLDWSRREARAAASRQNGRLGGRPRKAAAG